MLVHSTFTGWERKIMVTRARAMAMRRSRVQTRISFRREWVVDGAGAEISGTDETRGWFWSVLCILCCLLFIARGLLAALDSICARVDGLPSSPGHYVRFVCGAWRCIPVPGD